MYLGVAVNRKKILKDKLTREKQREVVCMHISYLHRRNLGECNSKRCLEFRVRYNLRLKEKVFGASKEG